MTKKKITKQNAHQNMKRVLFVFLHGIGDCLMFTPAVRMYKEKHPDRCIAILTLPLTATLWKKNKYIDAVFESRYFRNPPNHGNYLRYVKERKIIHKEIKRIKKVFNQDKVEYVVPHAYRICGITFPVPGILRRLFLDRFEDHQILRLCKRLAVGVGKNWPCDFYQELTLLKRNIPVAKKILHKKGGSRKMCIIHATASSQNKSLSSLEKKRIIQNVVKNKYTPVLLQEDSVSRKIATVYTRDILTSAALIKACDLFIGVDSGPSHIAEVLGKKRIIISKAFKTKLLYLPDTNCYLFDSFEDFKIQKAIKCLASSKN